MSFFFKISLIPSFNFELRYTFAETGAQLFAGNSLEDLLRWDLVMQMGVRQDLQDLALLPGALSLTGLLRKYGKIPMIGAGSEMRPIVRPMGSVSPGIKF